MSEPPTYRPSPDVIREFNDRGIQWLLEDPENLRGLLQVRDPDLAARLDFARAIRINRTFIPADLRKRESDVIFHVPFLDESAGAGRAVWVYVLLEHQTEPDRLMGLRLYFYMGALWDLQRREWEDRQAPAEHRWLHPVVPMVFYTGEERWSTPIDLAGLMDLPEPLARFVPRWETLFLDLRRTPAETLTRVATAVGWALRALQAERAPLEEVERILAAAMAGLEGLSEEQSGQWLRVAWYLVLLVFHRRSEDEKTVLIEKLREQARESQFHWREEIETMELTYAQVLEQRIEERVQQRIEQHAEQRAVRRSLETVLTARFGALPPEVAAAVAAASTEALEGWLQIASTAPTLDAVGIRPPEPEKRRRGRRPRKPATS